MPQRKGPRLDGRNGRIWQGYLSGHTQTALAEAHGISVQRVSQIISEVRASIPEQTKAELVTTSAERLDLALAEAFDVLHTPHYVVNSGRVVHDIEEYALDDDGNIEFDDHGNPKAAKITKLHDDGPRLQAIDRIVKINAEYRRLLGLDAPAKTEHTGPAGGPISLDVEGLTPEQMRRNAAEIAAEIARAYEPADDDGEDDGG